MGLHLINEGPGDRKAGHSMPVDQNLKSAEDFADGRLLKKAEEIPGQQG